MKTKDVIIIGAGVAIAGLLAYKLAGKGMSGALQDLGAGAVDAVGGLASGVVLGIGDTVGLPRTNATAGHAAWARGDYLQASKLLPAGEFLGNVWDAVTGGSNEPVPDVALARAQENARLYGGKVENWLAYEYIDNDPVQVRGSSLPISSKWGTHTAAGWPWEH